MMAVIANSLLDSMKAEAHRVFPKETGGILMGYESPKGLHLVITSVIGPGPKARNLRYGFIPDHEYHVRTIADIYAESGRCITYLGDWHSHPRGSSLLSNTDVATMCRISKAPEARCPRPLMMIVNGGPKWETTLWRWSERRWSEPGMSRLDEVKLVPPNPEHVFGRLR